MPGAVKPVKRRMSRKIGFIITIIVLLVGGFSVWYYFMRDKNDSKSITTNKSKNSSIKGKKKNTKNNIGDDVFHFIDDVKEYFVKNKTNKKQLNKQRTIKSTSFTDASKFNKFINEENNKEIKRIENSKIKEEENKGLEKPLINDTINVDDVEEDDLDKNINNVSVKNDTEVDTTVVLPFNKGKSGESKIVAKSYDSLMSNYDGRFLNHKGVSIKPLTSDNDQSLNVLTGQNRPDGYNYLVVSWPITVKEGAQTWHIIKTKTGYKIISDLVILGRHVFDGDEVKYEHNFDKYPDVSSDITIKNVREDIFVIEKIFNQNGMRYKKYLTYDGNLTWQDETGKESQFFVFTYINRIKELVDTTQYSINPRDFFNEKSIILTNDVPIVGKIGHYLVDNMKLSNENVDIGWSFNNQLDESEKNGWKSFSCVPNYLIMNTNGVMEKHIRPSNVGATATMTKFEGSRVFVNFHPTKPFISITMKTIGDEYCVLTATGVNTTWVKFDEKANNLIEQFRGKTNILFKVKLSSVYL